MNARMYLAGLGGGLLCSLVLWYPLAEYLPSTFLSAWPVANSTLAWGLVIVAFIITLISGAIAGRMSGTSSRLGATISGAICGLLAILIAYAVVAGAASGMWGARPVLEFGLKPAATDAQFLQLLVDAIMGVHWWSSLVLAGSLLIGWILGALGGFIAGPGGRPDPEIWLVYQIVGVGSVLVSGFNLVIISGTLDILVSTTQRTIAQNGLTPPYPPDTIPLFTIVTIFLVLYASLGVWWISYRRGLAAGQEMNWQVRISALLLVGFPLSALVFIAFSLYKQSLFYSLYLPLFLIAILVAAGILRHVWKNSSNTRPDNLTRSIIFKSAVLISILIVAGNYLGIFASAQADVMLIVTMIEHLTPGGTPIGVPGMMALVTEHYATYRNIGLLLVLIALPVFALIVSALGMVLMYFINRPAPSVQPLTS